MTNKVVKMTRMQVKTETRKEETLSNQNHCQ